MDSPQATLEKLSAEFLDSLEQGIIPFWLARAWDNAYGGFLTNFDEDGNELSTPEKYLNTQARMIWWFSTLCRHYPHRSEFKVLATRGIDFFSSGVSVSNVL